MDNRADEKTIGDKKKKPSRLQMALHLWGGMCLYTFAEISGLSEDVLALLKGSLKGSDPTSALYYAGAAGLLTVGTVAVGYFLSSSLVKVINSSALSQKSKTIIKGLLPFVYIIGVLLLVTVTSPIFTSTDSDGNGKSAVPKSNAIAPVVVLSTLHDTEGVTEEDLSLEGLKNLEMWSIATVLKKVRLAYAETGNDPSKFNPFPVSDSQYVTVSEKKLAIIKITLYPSKTDHSNAVKMVRIIGFTQKGVETVGCIRNSNHDIPVWSGECGNKIQEVFGVGIQP